MAKSSTYIGASPEALRHHYDVSNEFFSLWLDPTHTYSSAFWKDGEGINDLQKAQDRKLDYHIKQAKVSNSRRVLDIGCGWGSLLKRLVEKHSVEHSVGISLNKAHIDSITAWKHPKIEVLLENWTEHKPVELYDGIISLEVMEHFVRPNLTSKEKVESYKDFFNCCYHWLKPDGYMSIQTIVYENSDHNDFNQFFSTEIFPESDLARQFEILQASDRLFEVVKLENFRHDYVKTLKAWYRSLRRNRKRAKDIVGIETVQKYEKYLGLSIMGFYSGTMNVSCVSLKKL